MKKKWRLVSDIGIKDVVEERKILLTVKFVIRKFLAFEVHYKQLKMYYRHWSAVTTIQKVCYGWGFIILVLLLFNNKITMTLI